MSFIAWFLIVLVVIASRRHSAKAAPSPKNGLFISVCIILGSWFIVGEIYEHLGATAPTANVAEPSPTILSPEQPQTITPQPSPNQTDSETGSRVIGVVGLILIVLIVVGVARTHSALKATPAPSQGKNFGAIFVTFIVIGGFGGFALLASKNDGQNSIVVRTGQRNLEQCIIDTREAARGTMTFSDPFFHAQNIYQGAEFVMDFCPRLSGIPLCKQEDDVSVWRVRLTTDGKPGEILCGVARGRPFD
jgi:hypothetical protein